MEFTDTMRVERNLPISSNVAGGTWQLNIPTQNLLLCIIGMLRNASHRNEYDTVLSVSKEQVYEAMKLTGNTNALKIIKASAMELMTKRYSGFKYDKDGKRIDFVSHWLLKFWYYHKDGHFKFLMDTDLAEELLLEFQEYYVLVERGIVSRLKSKHSIRFLMWIEQFKKTGYFTITIEDLKQKLILTEKQKTEPDTSRILDRVVRPALRDIMKNTRYKKIDLEYIHFPGTNAIKAITLKWGKYAVDKFDSDKPEERAEAHRLLNILTNVKVHKATAQKLINLYSATRVERNFLYALNNPKTKELPKMVVAAIERDFAKVDNKQAEPEGEQLEIFKDRDLETAEVEK